MHLLSTGAFDSNILVLLVNFMFGGGGGEAYPGLLLCR